MKNDGKTVPAVSIGCHAGSRCCLNAESEGRFDLTLFSTISLSGIFLAFCFSLYLHLKIFNVFCVWRCFPFTPRKKWFSFDSLNKGISPLKIYDFRFSCGHLTQENKIFFIRCFDPVNFYQLKRNVWWKKINEILITSRWLTFLTFRTIPFSVKLCANDERFIFQFQTKTVENNQMFYVFISLLFSFSCVFGLLGKPRKTHLATIFVFRVYVFFLYLFFQIIWLNNWTIDIFDLYTYILIYLLYELNKKWIPIFYHISKRVRRSWNDSLLPALLLLPVKTLLAKFNFLSCTSWILFSTVLLHNNLKRLKAHVFDYSDSYIQFANV